MFSRHFRALTGLTALIAAGAWWAWPVRPTAERESYGLIIVIDGARGDVWRQYAEQGKMPNVARLFLEQGVWVEHATSVFPTITGAGMPAVLTGNVPGRHGMPSLYFFDRPTRSYPVLFTFRESLEWNHWLSPSVKTIWEHFEGPDDALSIGPALSRGADLVVPVVWNVQYKPMEYHGKLTVAVRQLERDLLGKPPARMTVVYNGWFDHMEHGLGATHPAMDAQYASVDAAIGEAVALFEATIDKRQAAIGRPVDRYVALVSDHGHQDVREVASIEQFVRGSKQARVVDKVWTRVFGLAVDSRETGVLTDEELVLAAGEGHALLYFPTPEVEGEQVVALDWDRRPSYHELRDYAFRGERVDLIAQATQFPQAVSFVVAKDYAAGVVHVHSHDGHATIERQGTHPTTASYRYRVVEGTDPLGFVGLPEVEPLLDDAFHEADTWQQATCTSQHPDAVVMLFQAFDSEDRAPDLYVSAAPYVSIGDLVDGAKSASKHGGLTQEETWSTVAFHGSGLLPRRVRTARNVDVVPTMLWLLGEPFEPESKDGRVLREIEEMIGAR
jgi:hypothetical protein